MVWEFLLMIFAHSDNVVPVKVIRSKKVELRQIFTS